MKRMVIYNCQYMLSDNGNVTPMALVQDSKGDVYWENFCFLADMSQDDLRKKILDITATWDDNDLSYIKGANIGKEEALKFLLKAKTVTVEDFIRKNQIPGRKFVVSSYDTATGELNHETEIQTTKQFTEWLLNYSLTYSVYIHIAVDPSVIQKAKQETVILKVAKDVPFYLGAENRQDDGRLCYVLSKIPCDARIMTRETAFALKMERDHLKDTVITKSMLAEYPYNAIVAYDQEDGQRAYFVTTNPSKNDTFSSVRISAALRFKDLRTAQEAIEKLATMFSYHFYAMEVDRYAPFSGSICTMDGQSFMIGLPQGGFARRSICDWNTAMEIDKKKSTWHWDFAPSICQETKNGKVIVRGGEEFNTWKYETLDFKGGFRPVIYPVDEHGNLSPEIFASVPDGTLVNAYTLLMNGEPVPTNIRKPIRYISGASLEITDEIYDEEYRIPFIVFKGRAMAAKNLLCYITARDLQESGLVALVEEVNLVD